MTDVANMLVIVVLGGILGTVGQLMRTVVGLKKLQDRLGPAWREAFDPVRLLTSLIVAVAVGSTAGVLYILNAPMQAGAVAHEVSRESLMAVVGAGYAGTDFIEGFIKRSGQASSQEGHGGGEESTEEAPA